MSSSSLPSRAHCRRRRRHHRERVTVTVAVAVTITITVAAAIESASPLLAYYRRRGCVAADIVCQSNPLCGKVSEHFKQKRRKKKGLTVLSNNRTANPRRNTSPEFEAKRTIALCSRTAFVVLSAMRSSSVELGNIAFALKKLSYARMKRNENAPGSPVHCKSVRPLYYVYGDPNEDGVRPGICACRNKASHETLAVMADLGVALEESETSGTWHWEV